MKENRNMRLVRRALTLAALVLVSLMSLTFIVQIPIVQTFGIRHIAGLLSTTLQTRVEVGKFGMNVFRRFSIGDVYVEDPMVNGDTLVYANDIDVRFANPVSLLSNRLHIKRVRLNGVEIGVNRPEGRQINSLDFVIEQMANRERSPSENPLGLDVDRIVVEEVNYHYDDELKNTISRFGVSFADIEIDSVNLKSKHLNLAYTYLAHPYVFIDQLAPPDTVLPSPDDTVQSTGSWRYEVESFTIVGGAFGKRKYGYEAKAVPNGINYEDLDIRDFNLKTCYFVADQSGLEASIEQLSLQEKSGFEIVRTSIENIRIDTNQIALTGIQINTPASFIGDSVRLEYDSMDDFKDFADKIRIDASFTDTRIAINDVLIAVPSLRQAPFFAQNAGRTLVLTGHVHGRVNRLIGENIYGELGRLTFRGDFRSRNLAIPQEEILNLRIQRAEFSARSLRQLLPESGLPERFNRLGNMVFKGNFDGYLYDFVAFGQLRSAIGSAEMDMQLDILDGAERARYSGAVALQNFDLGEWSGNSSFDTLTFRAQIENGRGLTAEHATANMDGVINVLDYKGYRYRNIVIDGELDDRFFDGSLEIADPNAAFSFNGSVDMSEEVPRFDFAAVVDTLNLHALNLIQDTVNFSGRMDIEGTVSTDLVINASANATNLKFTRGLDEHYTIDSLQIISNSEQDSLINYTIESDYINGSIDGKVAFSRAVPSIKRHLGERYSSFFPKIKYDQDTAIGNILFNYDLQFREADEWLGILGLPKINFRDLEVKGAIDLPGDQILVQFTSPQFAHANTVFDTLEGSIALTGGTVSAEVLADSVNLNRTQLGGLYASAAGRGDAIDWRFKVDQVLDSLAVDFYGSYASDTSGMQQVQLDATKSFFFDGNWALNKGNSIRWNKNFIEIENYHLRKDQNSIRIDDIDNKGLFVSIDSFDLSIIDVLWDYEQLDFDGAYTLRAEVDNIYDPKTINASMQVQDLLINDDPYGLLKFEASMPEIGDPLKAKLNIDRPGSHLDASATYYLPIPETDQELAGSFEGVLKLDTFPMAFLEYWLDDAIAETAGYGVGKVDISGDSDDADMNGQVRVFDASTLIGVLGTRYYINDQLVTLTKDRIDLTNVVLTDEKRNRATVTGGLTHTMMAKMGLDLSIQSNNIIGLDLDPSPGSPFYGYAEGAIRARFYGPVKSPELEVDATTGPETHISIPVESGAVDASSSFIRFVSDQKVEEETEREVDEIRGLSLLVNLSVTEDALIDIILNERTSEQISGRGNGDIQIEMTRTGDFSIFGNYEIESGDYLFKNLIVNKPFVLRPGGVVSWSGDPYEAQLNIQADYTGIRTSLTTFLQEYLVTASEATQQQAQQKTTVFLELQLTGSLLQPSIAFQISFPDVTGELRGYVDSKMSSLRADQNSLNEQVFGLLLLGTFLPSNFSNTSTSGNFLNVTATNTMTEFVSSQLSFYLSEFVGSAVENVGFISDIDINVAYNKSYDYTAQSSSYEEWELSVRNRLFNDRFIVDVGGNYVTDSPVAGTYFAGDYALEYVLTKDRRLKVRFYYRQDETIEGRKNKTGIGLSYRREFDSFGEWLRGLDKEAKRAAKDD